VLIVAAEDAREDSWKPRLQAAGADFSLVAFLDMPDTWNVRDGKALIADALDEHPAVLVFVDAVMEHLPEAHGSENAHATTFVRSALRPFANLCRERNVAGVISTHPPKLRGGSWENAYAGSAAFVQVSRSCLMFGWHPEDLELREAARRRVILRAAGNVGRDPGALAFRVDGKWVDLDDGDRDENPYVWDVEPCDYTMRDLLNAERPGAGSAPERKRPKVDVLAERIREYLADGEWHPSLQPELEREGWSAGTIQRARERATKVPPRPRAGMSGGSEWKLAPDPQTEELVGPSEAVKTEELIGPSKTVESWRVRGVPLKSGELESGQKKSESSTTAELSGSPPDSTNEANSSDPSRTLQLSNSPTNDARGREGHGYEQVAAAIAEMLADGEWHWNVKVKEQLAERGLSNGDWTVDRAKRHLAEQGRPVEREPRRTDRGAESWWRMTPAQMKLDPPTDPTEPPSDPTSSESPFVKQARREFGGKA